jgi:hypothetical protein
MHFFHEPFGLPVFLYPAPDAEVYFFPGYAQLAVFFWTMPSWELPGLFLLVICPGFASWLFFWALPFGCCLGSAVGIFLGSA